MRLERLVGLTTFALISVNLATTGHWSTAAGALRGWRWPYLAAALTTATVAFVLPRAKKALQPPAWLPWAMAFVGAGLLLGLLLVWWLPPASWPLIPFNDDWPPRFQSTVEGVRLLRQGAFAGWQWNFLGGYATASDVTQSLTLLGALPMMLLGNAVGFHLVNVLLFLAAPVLVFLYFRRESPGLARLAAGLTALSIAGVGAGFMQSGDTNSLAGLVMTVVVLVASDHARRGQRFGFAALAIALAGTACAHIGFLVYCLGLLLLEAFYYRDWRHAARCVAAGAAAGVMSLPVTYDLIRYPHTFVFNNAIYQPNHAIAWRGVALKIGYNIQILFEPSRWFNNEDGITLLFLPVVLFAAWRRDGRAGYFAWAALFARFLLFFDVPEAGYFFSRPMHLLLIFTPVVMAWFVWTRTRDGFSAGAMTTVAALCFPIATTTVPHVSSVADFVPALAQRIAAASGSRVLVENNPHRNVVAQPNERSERSLYGVHYEALLPEATGKMLYAGYWDGWQWTPFRGEMVAGGAWKGAMLASADESAFAAEMRKWGVAELFVWSASAQGALGAWRDFQQVWSSGPWREYVLVAPPVDTRLVVTDHGDGRLIRTTLLGGVVQLAGVERGDRVVVRTHFHPAWQARWTGGSIAPQDDGDQLSFLAPSDGSYDVTLTFPVRRWLLLLSGAMCAAVLALGARRRQLAGGGATTPATDISARA